MKTLSDYLELLDDRPKKFSATEVGYEPAPEGSELRCAGCRHYFRRATDGFTTCEIFRSPETDREGVLPDWRCRFFNVDGSVFHLLEADSGEDSAEDSDEKGSHHDEEEDDRSAK